MEQLARWLEAVNHPAPGDDSRNRAIAEMRAAGVGNVFPLLSERLTSSDPETRCEAITALVFLDASRAVEPVVAMLSDPDTVVRWQACGCLHDFGDETSGMPS